MPKTPLSFYLHIIAVAVIVFAVGSYVSSRTPDGAEGSPSIISGDSSAAPRNDNRESVYDRVMRTKTIRCGYVSIYPSIIKDPNTGEMSGISFDLMNNIATQLDVKLVWAEEVTFATMIEGLQNSRYDMICHVDWPNPARNKFVDYSIPVYFNAVSAYARRDDSRFDRGLNMIGSPTTKIATIDGEMAETIAKTDFPQAQLLSLPQGSDLSQMANDVAGGKADVALILEAIANLYEKNNPGKLKKISNKPIRAFPAGFVFLRNQPELKSAIDKAVQEVLISGQAAKILDKYNASGNGWLVPSAPYQLPAN